MQEEKIHGILDSMRQKRVRDNLVNHLEQPAAEDSSTLKQIQQDTTLNVGA